jgi:hypothetical protein
MARGNKAKGNNDTNRLKLNDAAEPINPAPECRLKRPFFSALGKRLCDANKTIIQIAQSLRTL